MGMYRVYWLTLSVALLGSGEASANELVIVPDGLADAEGNETGSVFQFSSEYRWQVVIPASEFTDLPPGGLKLVRAAFRPDKDAATPYTYTLRDYEVRLSTTSAAPGSLSATFAANTGPDETVVWKGDFLGSTANTGPANGPKDFDLVVEFQLPFFYDPAMGNLLWETRLTGIDSATTSLLDSHDPGGGVRAVWAFDLDATMASSTGTTMNAVQFTFVPEPSTAVLFGLALMCFVAWRQRKK